MTWNANVVSPSYPKMFPLNIEIPKSTSSTPQVTPTLVVKLNAYWTWPMAFVCSLMPLKVQCRKRVSCCKKHFNWACNRWLLSIKWTKTIVRQTRYTKKCSIWCLNWMQQKNSWILKPFTVLQKWAGCLKITMWKQTASRLFWIKLLNISLLRLFQKAIRNCWLQVWTFHLLLVELPSDVWAVV